MDEVTELRVEGVNKHEQNKLFAGIKPNNCSKPCTTTTINIGLLTNSVTSVTTGSVYFSEYVTIIKVDMVEFYLVTALSFLGSNMELWSELSLAFYNDH